MNYRKLGSSGLKVSEIGLGGNNFGWYADEETSVAVINQALEMGVNYIDTADWYAGGKSEEIIGKAVKDRRQQVVIATKFGMAMDDGPNEKGGSRHYTMRAVEGSLRRLKTDYIDLYQMHIPDPTTPIEETLRALEDLVREGKIRYTGCCNFSAWQLCEALWTSKFNNLSQSFVTAQARYNVLEREIEADLVPCCHSHDVGVIPWGPLAAGFLTGKYRKNEKFPTDGRLSKKGPSSIYDNVMSEPNWEKLSKLESFAEDCGHKVGELAIAWLLSKPWISSVIAGARKIEQVKANVASSTWKMSANEISQIDNIS